MTDYIDRESFIEQKRELYCADCERRKGMKNGKMRFVYDIGDAPCRACDVHDMMRDVEDFPAADVKPVVRGEWIDRPSGAYGRMQSWCSACGKRSGIGGIESNRHKPFCPNCGADMRGNKP